MKRIKINPDLLFTEARGFKRSSERLVKLGQELYDSFHSIDIEYSGVSRLNSLMINEIQQARQLSSKLETLSEFLTRSAAMMGDTDRNAANGLGNIEKINIILDNKKENPGILPIVNLPWISGLIKKPGIKIPTQPVSPIKPAIETGKGVWPVPGGRFDAKNGFGVKRSGVSTDLPNGHGGIDIWPKKPGVAGDPVLAPFAGQKVFAGPAGTNGNAVYINLKIDGVNYQMRFAHLNEIPPAILNMKSGESIDPGQNIGKMGYTGACVPPNASGTHLHLEVRVSKDGSPCNIKSGSPSNSSPIDPITFFRDKLKMSI